MKTKTTLLAVMLCFFLLSAISQNAPVTVLPQISNPPLGESFTLPVTISDFEDIGGISLIITFDASVLTFQGAIPNAAFNNILVNGTTTPGRLIVSWYAGYGVTLPDGAHLLDLTFLNNGGNTVLNWSLDDQGSCEYARYNGGIFNVLNDTPSELYYTNGKVTNGTAPLTWAPVISNAVAGNIDIPVKVNGFTNIGAISLTFEYDSAVIRYLNTFVAHPALASQGNWQIETQNVAGGKKYLVISWTRNTALPALPPCSLPANSTLITLKFNYISPGVTTELKWIDNGSSCEYANENYQPLNDSPAAVYYADGLVTSQHTAPLTVAPCVTGIPGQQVVIPVRVFSFNSIGAVSLTLEYNPAVLTYQTISAAGLPSSWTINAAATPGRFILGGFGVGFSLPDSSILFNITFIYNGGNCLLTWNDNGSSCEYADAATMDPLNDHPCEEFYQNGCVGPAPVVSSKVFLEGPFNSSINEMNTVLKNQDLIPASQPYNTSPWFYAGNEIASPLPQNLTDWVLVELRTSPLASSAIARRACLLKKNGIVTDMNGSSPPSFPGIIPGYYYLVIIHRNHLEVMSKNKIPVNPFSVQYNFSTTVMQAHSGSAGYKQLSAGIFGMASGDVSQDGVIDADDLVKIDNSATSFITGYVASDTNCDGIVNDSDLTLPGVNAENFIGVVTP